MRGDYSPNEQNQKDAALWQDRYRRSDAYQAGVPDGNEAYSPLEDAEFLQPHKAAPRDIYGAAGLGQGGDVLPELSRYARADRYQDTYVYSEEDESAPPAEPHTGNYSYLYQGKRIQMTGDIYSDVQKAAQTAPVSQTQQLDQFVTQQAPINRNAENTGYVLFGAGSATGGEEREMASHSGNTPSPSESARLVKQSAKREKREFKRRNRIKSKRNRRVFLFVWWIMVALIGFTLGEYLSVGAGDVFAMRRTKELSSDITIPVDATLDEVTDALYDAKAIDNKQFFKMYCIFTNTDQFGRGEFMIPRNMDYEGIINYLLSNSNRLDAVEIMFYEGMNLLEIAELLAENEVCSVQEVMDIVNSDAFDDYDLIAGMPVNDRYYKLEGYLFPDTYQFYLGEGAQTALSKMIYNCQNKLTEKMLKAADEMGLTPDELLIMASLVQAEASNEDDMYMVSSVLHNRLHDGAEQDIYTLDLDTTIYYPYRTKNAVPKSELNSLGDYNTYRIRGLPPGPICSPGLQAIEAVLNPAETEYYYFCHSSSGEPFYASTKEEHDENLVLAGLVDPEEEPDSSDEGNEGYEDMDENYE